MAEITIEYAEAMDLEEVGQNATAADLEEYNRRFAQEVRRAYPEARVVVHRTESVPGYSSSIHVTVDDFDEERPWDQEVAIEDHLQNISMDVLGSLYEDARP